MWGSWQNGKTTLLSTIQSLLGTYAKQIPSSTLLAAKYQGHPTELADLFGIRMAVSTETDSGGNFNESRIKQLTGGDKIRARRMREDFWEYDPTHKLWMITNHKPVIRGTDTAIWRRIRLIPFVVTIPPEKRDNRLLEKLKGELGGILGWAIEGCLLWQKEGLAPPKSVVNATAAYRHEMDAIGSFLDECCEVNHDPSKATLFTTKEKVVYEAYLAWAKSGGEYVMPRKQFTEQLSVKGIERIRRNSGMFLVGVRLISGNDETESGPHRKRKCDVCGGKGCVQCNFSGWRAYTL